MAAFVQTLLQGGTGGALITITITGSKTVTVGNDIYLLFASPNPAVSHVASDNLGNTYTIVHVYDGNPEITSLTQTEQVLFHAPVTAGGTLTSQTVTWTNGVSQVALGSVEFTDAVTPALTAKNGNGGSTSASLTIGGVSGVLLWTHAFWRFGTLGTYTPPAGYTNALLQDTESAKCILDYKIGSSSGLLSASWTNSAEWTVVHTDIAGVAVFRPQIIRYNRP